MVHYRALFEELVDDGADTALQRDPQTTDERAVR
jgi:hypothetical protein